MTRENYQGRVTVDIDAYKSRTWRFSAARCYYNLRRIADRVEIHISSSGAGLHLVGWFSEPLSFETKWKLRSELGDDARRVDIDRQRWLHGIYHGVLWDEKNVNDGRKERRFTDIWDAIDLINDRRKEYSRMNALANYGHKGDPELARRRAQA